MAKEAGECIVYARRNGTNKKNTNADAHPIENARKERTKNNACVHKKKRAGSKTDK